MFKGLGTNGELWSGVMTQYCEGVAVGATTCPTGSAHVGVPDRRRVGRRLGGRRPRPRRATRPRSSSVPRRSRPRRTSATPRRPVNRNAQYVVVSPTGTHPDGFNTAGGNFCAWHDYNGDPYVGVASPYGDIAFTNVPYVTDMGTSCGQNYVNAGTAGTLDGVTIVEGHEYAETITDQNPAGGWTDSGGCGERRQVRLDRRRRYRRRAQRRLRHRLVRDAVQLVEPEQQLPDHPRDRPLTRSGARWQRRRAPVRVT